MSSTISWKRCRRCNGSGESTIWGSTYDSNRGVSVKCSECAGTGKVALQLRPWEEVELHAWTRGSRPSQPEPTDKPWRPSDDYDPRAIDDAKANEAAAEARKQLLAMWEMHDAPLIA